MRRRCSPDPLAPDPPTHRRRRARLRSVALVASLAGLAAAACSSDRVEQVPTATVEQSTSTTRADHEATTTTEPITTTTAKPTPEEEVEAAYLTARESFYDVATDPDPADGRVHGFAAGTYAKKVRSLLADMRNDGIHLEFPSGAPPEPNIISVTVKGELAGVEACAVDDVRQIDGSGRLADGSIVSRTTVARMELTARGWVITDLVSKRNLSGPNGCKS